MGVIFLSDPHPTDPTHPQGIYSAGLSDSLNTP